MKVIYNENELNVVEAKTTLHLLKLVEFNKNEISLRTKERRYNNILRFIGDNGEKISGDIAYIKTKDRGWCYLSSYMDLYKNEILAWNFSPSMNVELVLSTLEKIPKKHLKGSIVHTDRGSQDTSREMREKLREYGT